MTSQTSTLDLRLIREAASVCACFNLRKAARAVTQFYDAALAPTGLKATQFSVLVAVSLTGPVPISRLAEALVMDRTTLTRNLKPLLKAELVAMTPGSDRRSRLVALTEVGRAALTRALPLWKNAQQQVAAVLGERRLGRLLADLGAAVAAVNAE